MIIVLVLLFIVLCIFSYLFFAPFYFEINSSTDVYRIRFHKLASVSLKLKNNSLFAEIKLAFWTKEFDILEKRSIKKEKPHVNEKKNKTEIKIHWRMIKVLLKSFKVNRFSMSIDVGNMQTNGILYPVLYGISTYTKKNIEINFINKNLIIIEIENSIARMSCSYIKYLLQTNKNKQHE
jgi:hypothetical protein